MSLLTRIGKLQQSKMTFFLLSAVLGIVFQSNPLITISLSLLTLILFERSLRIKIPTGIAISFVLFIIFSLVFGSSFDFYERFFWWDDLLHGFYGGAFALIGFLLIQYISAQRNIRNDIFIICLFSFCFSVSFGAMWEIYEFSYDSLVGGNMQHTEEGRGVDDTMHDIILESLSAFAVNVFIYFYISTGTRNWVGIIWEDFLATNRINIPKFPKIKIKTRRRLRDSKGS